MTTCGGPPTSGVILESDQVRGGSGASVTHDVARVSPPSPVVAKIPDLGPICVTDLMHCVGRGEAYGLRERSVCVSIHGGFEREVVI